MSIRDMSAALQVRRLTKERDKAVAERDRLFEAPHVTCVARDSSGKLMSSVHLLGDPEAVAAVMLLRKALTDAFVVFADTEWAKTYAFLSGGRETT